ncbi:7925_t:CDS:1 [Ambispora gerdemannii]|uniref:7925_t:CDS:1 n=1 Tax=Ambispora gerdemannii TaxID=144530 RepID=A0A9N9GEK0_9GLOM|nr:7925_t:CDS:1 [Ambispora gerdemannii]
MAVIPSSNTLTRRDASLSDTKDNATYIILGLIIGLFLLLGILIIVAIVRARTKKATTTNTDTIETIEVTTQQQLHQQQAKDSKEEQKLSGEQTTRGETSNSGRKELRTFILDQNRNSNGSTLVGLSIRDSVTSAETIFTSPRASRASL